MWFSDPIRRARLVAAAALALAGALAGCGDLPRPFQPDGKTIPVVQPVSPQAAEATREPVSVAVQTVANLPAEGGTRLAAAMAVALRNQGIAADVDPRVTSYTLAGIANAREIPNELEVKVTWFLLDPRGYRLAQQEQLTRGRVEDWIDGNDRLVSRIAQTNAPVVAAMIAAHVDAGATARPAAPQPGARPAQPPPRPSTAATSPAPAPRAQPAAGAAARPAPAAPAAPGPVRVVVPKVSGAPGDGGDSLAAGMKQALGRRSFAVVTRPDPDSLTVRGKVEMRPFNDGRQVITITWAVLDSRNNQVGEIEQSNVIPAGSLDGAWGPVAREIAIAAAEGLLDLLDKASKAGP